MRRRLLWIATALCAGGSLFLLAAKPPPAAGTAPGSPPPAQVAHGRNLFVAGCASCHGFDAEGRRGIAPSLHGVGAQAADFYLSTGRMPLSNPREVPIRQKPAYPRRDIDAIVAYVASLGGPPVPSADPSRGSVGEGMKLFASHCAGCHQIQAQGGIVTGGVAPPLTDVTPTQIAEAVRIGPYLMPRFSPATIDQSQLDSIAAYVQSRRHAEDRGGWGIGHIGPIPEGMVAWLLAGTTLLLVARLIGERS